MFSCPLYTIHSCCFHFYKAFPLHTFLSVQILFVFVNSIHIFIVDVSNHLFDRVIILLMTYEVFSQTYPEAPINHWSWIEILFCLIKIYRLYYSYVCYRSPLYVPMSISVYWCRFVFLFALSFFRYLPLYHTAVFRTRSRYGNFSPLNRYPLIVLYWQRAVNIFGCERI